MKKIMLVISSLGGGGAERAICQLADALTEEGVEVHLVTWSDPKRSDFYSVDGRVNRCRLNYGALKNNLFQRLMRGLSVVFGMRALMRRISPDCVLSFIDQSNVLSLVAAIGLPVRVIVAERIDPRANDTLGFGWCLARVLAYQRAQVVVAQTSGVAAWMERRWHVRTVVIPNFLRKLPDPAPEREPYLISVGRLVSQKAFDVSINAFARVAKEHPEWQYVILGAGPCREEWVQLSHTLGISDRVHFHGLVDNVEFWLSRASIAVQPSRFEGFPNAVMEAMAMGVATISSDCPSGPADLIKQMHNGVLVPIDDVVTLAREMDNLMKNLDLREQIGTRAMVLRETLSARSIMARWNDVLFDTVSISEGLDSVR